MSARKKKILEKINIDGDSNAPLQLIVEWFKLQGYPEIGLLRWAVGLVGQGTSIPRQG